MRINVITVAALQMTCEMLSYDLTVVRGRMPTLRGSAVTVGSIYINPDSSATCSQTGERVRDECKTAKM